MDNSLKNGFMAVFAVSGSVVFIAMQAHKHLLSNFMKKMEFEFNHSSGSGKDHEPKKKVRFSDEVVERASKKARGKMHLSNSPSVILPANNDENLEAMPENWQVMYKWILQHRNLRGYI